ncbi:conserved hypothetical protein [delta proteobacterium NaphS2]|nr:conserved hypothetical protein [delta proteobacterium NaphS2]
MKSVKILLTGLWLPLLILSFAHAGDFNWMRDFNVTAQADPSGFRARLDARFQAGDVNAVLSSVATPSDVYMLLRLGEMSHQPVERVIHSYKTGKGKGWGTLAKSLGIKPGSTEFHALKQGQDLYTFNGDQKKGKGKSKGKGKKNK